MPNHVADAKADEARISLAYVFPFLAIAVLAYGGTVFIVGADRIPSVLNRPLYELTFASRTPIPIFVRDAFVLGVFALLFCEVWKSAVHEMRAITNHLLSLLVTATSVYSLLNVEGYSTITFLYITLATVFDVVAGIYITWRSKPIHEPVPVFIFKRK